MLGTDVGFDTSAWPLDIDKEAKLEAELRPDAVLGPPDAEVEIPI